MCLLFEPCVLFTARLPTLDLRPALFVKDDRLRRLGLTRVKQALLPLAGMLPEFADVIGPIVGEIVADFLGHRFEPPRARVNLGLQLVRGEQRQQLLDLGAIFLAPGRILQNDPRDQAAGLLIDGVVGVFEDLIHAVRNEVGFLVIAAKINAGGSGSRFACSRPNAPATARRPRTAETRRCRAARRRAASAARGLLRYRPRPVP